MVNNEFGMPFAFSFDVEEQSDFNYVDGIEQVQLNTLKLSDSQDIIIFQHWKNFTFGTSRNYLWNG